MLYGKLIKFPGLDGHPVAVDKNQVVFLDEAAVAGEPVTNIHFTTGKWVTARGTVDEIVATLEAKEEQDGEAKLEEWRESARQKRQAQAEVDAVMRAVNYDKRVKHWGTETLPDGRRKVVAYLDPLESCYLCGEPAMATVLLENGAQPWCGCTEAGAV